jgi:transcriptional regulator with XRE-family HTH domain
VAKEPKQDGARLQSALAIFKRRLSEVATVTGIPLRTLDAIMSGTRSLGREDLRALAKYGIPADYLLGAVDDFTPPGETRIVSGAPREQDETTGTLTDLNDGHVRGAMQNLLKALPLQHHLVFEYRGLSAVAIKLAEALRANSRVSMQESYQLAGRLLGECIAAPVRILGLHVPPEETRYAQAFVSAMAHAVEILAYYARATPKVAPATRKRTKARKPRRT